MSVNLLAGLDGWKILMLDDPLTGLEVLFCWILNFSF